MGSVFLTLFVGNLIVGWIGGFYEHMTPVAFWGMQVAIGVGGAVLALLLKRPLEKLLLPA
jgi:POT family proton-dependent oligopeptide transporter